MDFDQLTADVKLHRLRVDAGGQPLPDEITGYAVESLGDLNVPVRGNLRIHQVGMSNAPSGIVTYPCSSPAPFLEAIRVSAVAVEHISLLCGG
jgi:hypothetical protein